MRSISYKQIKVFSLSILFAFVSIAVNVAYCANVEIISSENISTRIASLGGIAKSVKVTGISRDGRVMIGHFVYAVKAQDYTYFRYETNLNRVEILNPIFEKNFIPDGSKFDERLSELHISADGNVIAGSYFTQTDKSNHVFVYSDAKGFKDYGNLGLAKSIINVNGLSADGSLLVGEYSPPQINWKAFKYSEDKGFVDLQGMGKEHAFANGTSSDGSIIVGDFRNGAEADHAFKYSPSEGVVDVASIGIAAFAKYVSDDGKVILGTYLGGFSLNTLHSYPRIFLYTPKGGVNKLGTMSFLGDWSEPLSISEKGDYFNGVYVDYFGESHTFKAKITE